MDAPEVVKHNSGRFWQVGKIVGLTVGASTLFTSDVIRHAYGDNTTTLEGQLHTAQQTSQLPEGIFTVSQIEGSLHQAIMFANISRVGMIVGGVIVATSAIATLLGRPRAGTKAG